VNDVAVEAANLKTIDQIIQETSNKTTRNTSSQLGKNEFLNLLVTQLKYQDPLEPMEDKEFIAQMAQFSALEQMQNLNDAFQSMKAFSLIGSTVTATVDDDVYGSKVIQGVVTHAKISSKKAFVVVNGTDVEIDRIIEVGLGPKESEKAGDIPEENSEASS